ncbi:MAG: hypothetical protein ACK5PB_21155 [Pirellula sp.]|jgi:hypothetical protein
MSIAEQLRKSETMSLESVKKRAREIANGAKLNQEKDLAMLRMAGVSIEQFEQMVEMARQIPAMRAASHEWMKHEAAYTVKATERNEYVVETKRILKEREDGERRLRSECGQLQALARESREAMAWLEKHFPDDEIIGLHAKRKDVIQRIVQHETSMASSRRELNHIDQSLSRGINFAGGGSTLSRNDIKSMNERRPVVCDQINKHREAIEHLQKEQADIDRAIEQHLCGASQTDI